MDVADLGGHASIDNEPELDRRLRSVRQGDYGAFILQHESGGSSLWLHFNEDVAYLHYFPAGRHAGYQATGMSPGNCEDEVRFILVGGADGDAIEMPRETLVPVALAYRAAAEYLRVDGLPESITWCPL